MATEKDKEKTQHGHTESKSTQTRATSASKSTAKSENKTAAKSTHGKLAAGKSARTTDHALIQRWIEERGGSPAAVKATESKNDPGMLRINFPGYSGEDRLEDISWDEFFKKFDEKHLEFLYQDETRDGETSRFWKFVNREDEKPKKGDK